MIAFARTTVPLAAVLALSALTACGGGSHNNTYTPPYGSNACNPGTDVQLAQPASNSQGVSTGVGQVIIVANSNNNVLYANNNLFALQLASNAGDTINAGTLGLTQGNNLVHPYNSDFYYSASVPALPAGRTWSVSLVEPGSVCTPYFVGVFST